MNIQSLLTIPKTQLQALFPILESRLGLPASIYYPMFSFIYDEDSNIQYNDTPDEEKNILVAQLFDNSFIDAGLSESFELDDVVWYCFDNPPPERSKVVITYFDTTKTFIVDYIKKIANSLLYQIYLRAIR